MFLARVVFFLYVSSVPSALPVVAFAEDVEEELDREEHRQPQVVEDEKNFKRRALLLGFRVQGSGFRG